VAAHDLRGLLMQPAVVLAQLYQFVQSQAFLIEDYFVTKESNIC